MYYVIGGDGQQYGPIDEATLRGWLGAGRITPASLSFRQGETQWLPVRDRTEFERDLREPVAAPPSGQGLPVPNDLTTDPPKDWRTAFLLSYFLGILGVDRFYLGHTGLGIAKLLVSIVTCGVGGVIWGIVDILYIAVGNPRDGKGRLLTKY